MLKNSVRAGLPLLAICLACSPAYSQIDESVIEEIIVTAPSKRAQTLQEVPVAVSVVSAQTLEQAQINDALDLQSAVPSLRVSQLQTSGNTNFIIRGFGNGANNPGIEPSVGVFIDGVYRSRSASALADFPNLQSIEVLRGPQSTLFGKNASAGVISVKTAAPSLDALNGSASLVYGNYNQVIVKGDINGPLSDTFGFSLSGSVNQRDGYFTNLANGSEINERDRWGVRGQLLWVPTDTLSFRLIADSEEIDEKCCGVANLVNGPTGVAVQLVGGQLVPNAPYAREQYYDFDPTNKIENSGVSLQADWDIGESMLLTSITAFRNQSRKENADVDFTSAALITENSGDTEIDTFTQELRLGGSTDALDWMVGGFYFDESVDYDNVISYGPAFRSYADILAIVGSGGTPGVDPSPFSGIEAAVGIPNGTFFGTGQGTVEDTGQDDTTISLFSQFDIHFTDRMTATVGANYTQVDKDVRVGQTNTDTFSNFDLVGFGAAAIFSQLTGLPPTPANIGANPVAWATAQALSTVPCTPTNAPACNPALALTPFQFLPPVVNFPNSVEDGSTSDSKTTWMARLAYDVSDNINMYVSAGTGFKATSWNMSRDSKPFAADIDAINAAGLAVPNMTAGTRYAGPEEATVYELGFKGRWGGNWVNIAVFDQSIEGFQSNIFTGTGFVLANAGEQSTTGVELESSFLPTDAFQFNFAATWLDPVYDSADAVPGVGDDVGLTGERPAGIPTWSINTNATYDFALGSIDAFIRGEWVYESEVQVVENVPESVASREVNMFNASLGMTFGDRFDVMLWGRNLTDNDFLQSAFPSVAQEGSYSGYPNQPRTYGITLTASFE